MSLRTSFLHYGSLFFPLKDSSTDSEVWKISAYSSYRSAFLETLGIFLFFFPLKPGPKLHTE